MLAHKTTFVVGAGASFEFGLPLGDKLRHQIVQKLHFRFDFGRVVEGDEGLVLAIMDHAKRSNEDPSKYFKACARLRDGLTLARSIDNFINTHRDDSALEFVAKLAIFDCILDSERASSLWLAYDRDRQRVMFNQLEATWLHQFASAIFAGHQKDDLESVFENCAIVCFNYDRVIEFYLVHALISYFGVERPIAESVVSKIEIIHPYGVLGTPYQNDREFLPFGATIARSELPTR